MGKCTVLFGCAFKALCLSSSLSTGAAVPELQLFGQFGGSPILLATTEQLTYFDCRSYVKYVCASLRQLHGHMITKCIT